MSTSSEPSTTRIPLCEPEISGSEWTYVRECLDSGWVSSVGRFVTRFEELFAARLRAPGAVAVASGTAALHLALLASGVEPGDEVLLPALTFIAPANAVRYVGAWPRFIDVEPSHWQLDPECVRRFIERDCAWEDGTLVVRSTGRRLRAILPVHILGHPVDMDPLLELTRRFGLVVIEDATESLGATYRGRPVGRIGDIACFSFNGNKLMTTGGGGMIVSDRPDWLDRARYLSTQARDDTLEYVHGAIGYNYRLTNVQAAIGCAQLERIDEFLERKREIARCYADGLAHMKGLTPLGEAPWARSAFWLYTVRIDEAYSGRSSRGLIAELARHGIEARPLWQPLDLSVPHRSSAASCPIALDAHRSGVSLPSSVGLSPTDQARVIDVVRAWMHSAASSN